MTEHSLLGASSAYRWLACPGSFALSQTAPHRPASIYAATGTVAHELIEACASDKDEPFRPLKPADAGETCLRDGHEIVIDEHLIAGVNVMLEYLRDRQMLSSWMDVEYRVNLFSWFPTPPPVEVFGTLDAGVLIPPTLEIVDYKNGSGVTVDVTDNPQLLFYAAGALRQLPAEKRDQVKRIRLTIVQPNAGGTPIRSQEIDLVDLLMWIDDVLVPGVNACAQPDAPLNAGSWCRWCPVSHDCPLLHQAALEAAKAEFNTVLLMRDSLPSGVVPGDSEQPGSIFDPTALAQALETAERAEMWINAVREFALDQLHRQVRIPGWELQPTRATRKWLLPDDDIAARLRDLGAGPQEIWETRLRSPAQAEKALQRTRQGKKIWEEAAPVLVEARSSGFKVGRSEHSAQADFEEAP